MTDLVYIDVAIRCGHLGGLVELPVHVIGKYDAYSQYFMLRYTCSRCRSVWSCSWPWQTLVALQG